MNQPRLHPPQRLLMGPGPSTVSARVLEALSRPTVGHLDPFFSSMMEDLKEKLKKAFKTSYELTFPISAPGSAGMEACLVNLVEPGDEVLVCKNGVFGGRMAEIVEKIGGKLHLIEDEWGKPVDPQKVEDTLKQNSNIKVVAFVHAETSTGALSDAKTLCEIARKHDALTVADTVTSLAGSELEVEAWGIDATYSGSQKCMSCIPGISPVSFSPKAVAKIQNRKTPVLSWFLDLNKVMGYWGNKSARTYHHTAPVNSMYALNESLDILLEEGLENSWKRHKENSALLMNGLLELGFKPLCEASWALPQLNAVILPQAKLAENELRSILLNEYSIEVGGGLGDLSGKIWRIGLMGDSCRKVHVGTLLAALKQIL